MSNTQTIRHEHVKAIVNTGNIIAMLNHAGLDNDKSAKIAQEIDVQINAALDEKLGSEDVIKIVEERLDDVATKEFVRAEIQGVKTDIQTVKSEIQNEIQIVAIDMQKGLRQNLTTTIGFMVGFMSIICGVLYFALTYHLK